MRKQKTEYPEQHERAAARRYLEHDHASQTLHGAPAGEANRHAQAIDEEHPRARDIALTGTQRELGKLPAHLRRHQLEAARRAGLSREDIHHVRREYRSGPAQRPEQEPREHEPREPGPVSRAGDQAVELVGSGFSAAADTSWGELFGELIMAGIGLSLLYLLLTHDTAVSKLFEGATHVTRALVSPVVDPLNPKGAVV